MIDEQYGIRPATIYCVYAQKAVLSEYGFLPMLNFVDYNIGKRHSSGILLKNSPNPYL